MARNPASTRFIVAASTSALERQPRRPAVTSALPARSSAAPRRRQLMNDLGAVTLFFDHPLKAMDLSLHTSKSGDDIRRVVIGYIVPYQGMPCLRSSASLNSQNAAYARGP